MTIIARPGSLGYEGLLAQVRYNGEPRTDRTGTGTLSLFAPEPLRYRLDNFRVPLITSKAVSWRMALKEFMWMLSGSTNTHDLLNGSMQAIWNNWADPDGELGPTYGAQYRNAGAEYDTGAGVDQLAEVIDRLVRTPDTRRALISLWSVPELEFMALEPCMVLFQFSLRGPNLDQLELHIYQRSADLMLGVPFDLFQGGLLAHLIARELTFRTGRLIQATSLTWSAGDTHIYNNQLDAVDQQLSLTTWPHMNARVVLPGSDTIRLLDGSLTASHIDVINYHSAPAIRAPLAI